MSLLGERTVRVARNAIQANRGPNSFHNVGFVAMAFALEQLQDSDVSFTLFPLLSRLQPQVRG